MTTQHTPGWLSVSNDADIIGTENDSESGWVGTVDVAHVYLREQRDELLAALTHIEGVAMAGEWRDLPEIAKAARAAIAKAEGKA